jgi:hypothetical protein
MSMRNSSDLIPSQAAIDFFTQRVRPYGTLLHRQVSLFLWASSLVAGNSKDDQRDKQGVEGRYQRK